MEEQRPEAGPETILDAWMKSAMDFWGGLSKMDSSELFGTIDPTGKMKLKPLKQAKKSFESGTKIMQTLMQKLSEPENLDAVLKGLDTIPDVTIKFSQMYWDGFFELHKQWMDRAARIGQQTKAYDFEDIDKDMFENLRELYDKEIRKIFNVPQIGLTRFYQERTNRLMDKYNIFQTALSEFLYMFYIPLEKSLAVMQEKTEAMVDDGQVYDNYKDYYNMWIRILEGHYMTLLKSPEYTTVLNNTIRSLVEYRNAKDEVLYDMLKQLPIPTNKDMDELYKDFYLLKKKVNELSRKLNEL